MFASRFFAAVLVAVLAAVAAPAAALPAVGGDLTDVSCPSGDRLLAAALPAVVPASCDIIGKTLVDAQGVELRVPSEGYRVAGFGLGATDGNSTLEGGEFAIETASDGSVSIITTGSSAPAGLADDHDHDEQNRSNGGVGTEGSEFDGMVFPDNALVAEEDWEVLNTGRAGACADDRYDNWEFSEHDDFQWSFNTTTVPIPLTIPDTKSSMRSGMNTIEFSRTNCNYEDQVSASNTYLGDTLNRYAEMHDDGCDIYGTSDGYNTVDFKEHIPGNYIAYTCVEWFSGNLTHADISFDRDKGWHNTISTACTSGYDIKAVMTHEAGHVFGMWHVTNSNLTMNNIINQCQTRARTLGKGDILLLRLKY